MLWQFHRISPQFSNQANRVASLFPSLSEFYIFLQTWGLNEPEGNNEVFQYNNKDAAQNERELEYAVDLLDESLQNLEFFFNEDDSIEVEDKQNMIFE